MDRFQWLLALHVSGAFLFLGGSVTAGVFAILALRRERPSEIAFFLGLTRIAVISVIAGMLLTFVLGLWLVHDAHYSYGSFWVSASILLLIVAGAVGGIGGKRDRETRVLAERLATEGDAPSTELHARLRDPKALVLSWGAGACLIAILILMVWKPGS